MPAGAARVGGVRGDGSRGASAVSHGHRGNTEISETTSDGARSQATACPIYKARQLITLMSDGGGLGGSYLHCGTAHAEHDFTK